MTDYASIVQKNLHKNVVPPTQQISMNQAPVDLQEVENDNAIAMALHMEESDPVQLEIRRQQEEIAMSDEAFALELQRQIDASLLNDEAIAQELQNQLNKEYNQDITRMETQRNGMSKLNLSFEKYKFFETENEVNREEEEDVQDGRDWDRFDSLDRKLNSIPPCGYVEVNGSFLTKHDISLNGQKNMMKMMNLPPNVQTGDGAAEHYEISNKILNGLKKHSKKGATREKSRAKDKKDEAYENERSKAKCCGDLKIRRVDPKTAAIMNKFLKGDEPYLKSINGLINEGKEAVVFHADGSENIRHFEHPLECVMKVFKTVHCEFKQHDQYIRDDYRFKDRYNSKMAKDKIINLWAEKEMINLKRLRKADIPCPEVIALKANVLLCKFIGENEIPAPKLKDAALSLEEYHDAYEQVVNSMKDMYCKAKLVHGDLSEYNILWYQGKCVFIDVSQAVEPAHENAIEFLKRDCQNITDFFMKKKVTGTMSSEELFESITGHNSDDVEAINRLQRSREMILCGKVEDETNQGTTKLFDDHFKKAQDNNLLLEPQRITAQE